MVEQGYRQCANQLPVTVDRRGHRGNDILPHVFRLHGKVGFRARDVTEPAIATSSQDGAAERCVQYGIEFTDRVVLQFLPENGLIYQTICDLAQNYGESLQDGLTPMDALDELPSLLGQPPPQCVVFEQAYDRCSKERVVVSDQQMQVVLQVEAFDP